MHWAKITAWSDDGVPTFATPVRLPGAVSLSIDANGENENFYADNSVYYVINNNAGYDGDLEVALITTDFATAILGEQLDAKGVLVERNDAETSQFALMFEFDGDKNHIRHLLVRQAGTFQCKAAERRDGHRGRTGTARRQRELYLALQETL